jgi:uncharacterized protein (DUF488 family)
MISTIGYGGIQPEAFFQELNLLNPDMVVDVRENPNRAYLAIYTRNGLKKKLCERYLWIPELGNKSRSLPPTLVNEAQGFEILRELLRNYNHVTLLCSEKDEDKCHRRYIREKITETILDKIE